MSNISDMIEEFLIKTLGDDNYLDISRNDLASYFNVAPSQINYVLSTRFNYERGFLIESKRGGGGYITIMRADTKDSTWLNGVIDRLNDGVDYRTACYIIDSAVERNVLHEDEAEIIKIALSPSALSNPFKLENHLRAQILQRILVKHKKFLRKKD